MKYPFSPDVLDAMPEELAELFRGLELKLLEEITSRLIIAGQLNEVTVQSIRALRSHGIELDNIINAIKKDIKKTVRIGEKDFNKLLNDVVERNQEYYAGLADLASITAPEAIVGGQVIQAIIQQANDTYRNITRSMGFLVDAGRTMLPPAKAYQWALDNAAMQIQSGAISYNEAIANATRQLADSGLTIVEYESGHRDQVDVAVRRAVMTSTAHINSQYAMQSMDFLGADYVEVSAHSGARDKDGPLGWENHKAWQGKVYYWKEKANGANTENAPDFETTCGYGSVTGIYGANCRHSFTVFLPGIMERTYTDEQLANIDPPDFEYEGKTYTHYEATQKQREIERTIRKWKRREAAAVNPEDKQAAQIRIQRLKTKYKEFSEAANLRMQPERMQNYIDDRVVVTNTPLEVMNPVYGFKEVTTEWYAKATPYSHNIRKLSVFEQDGVRYRVDNLDVKLEISENEKSVAELLRRDLGGEIYHVPKVQGHYSGIKTPDYLFRGERLELKTPDSINGKHMTFYNMIDRRQADNFVFDISKNGMSVREALEEISALYGFKHAAFIKKIILVKDGQILSIFDRA